MTEFVMEAADVCVGVKALYDSTKAYCREYLSRKTPDFFVTVTPEDIAAERQKAAKEDALEGLPIRELTQPQLELTALLRKITGALFERDILLFHGSVVAVDGKAYLFTAKSGTGKSTHTRLWRELLGDRAVMVNDDKPFLKMDGTGVLAYGSAWMGKHGLGNRIAVPLAAICILERGAENTIREIPPGDAVHMLLQQSSRPGRMGHMPHYLELVDRLSAGVRFYRMQCNMEIQAAQIAYGAMAKENG